MWHERTRRGGATRRARATLVATAGFFALAISACDLTVTNPGPVPDSYLGNPAAHVGMVNGMGRALSDALNWVTLTGGAVSGEVVGSGNLIAFGVTLKQRVGELDPNEINDHWNRAQRARWVAEDGIRRMREALGSEFGSSPLAARALLYAGYANRLLGENFCDAVFDGGPIEPRARYFERAEAAFTEAITVAQAAGVDPIATAAVAGRAAVRVWLDDWTGAVADAQAVPKGFRYDAKMTSVHLDEYNRIVWATANQPFRTISVVNTFYADYYAETLDPRTPWDTLPGFPYGDSGDPPVRFYRQRKYTNREDGIPLSKWEEMQLILAEARLRSGDWTGAMTIINDLRAEAGVEPWSAANEVEAWERLKRERGIVLWLEGRRLGDLHRWREAGTPGANPDDVGQDSCFPIGQDERDTDPNIN